MRLFSRSTPPPKPPLGISVAGPEIVVRYDDYPEWDTQTLTDDPWQLHRSEMLRLAMRAAEADPISPQTVASRGVGLADTLRFTFEVRLPITPNNLLALLASGLEWTPEATELSRQANIPKEAVEAVRQKMRKFASDELAPLRRLLGQDTKQ